MNKWLVVLDQVGWGRMASIEPSAQSLTLSYVPRTTPVGHATISTGTPPAAHRIQGRTWWEPASRLRHDIGSIRSYPVPPVFRSVVRDSLAARLRRDARHHDAAIVCAAAKDFIPFLFGAWDVDVAVYPDTTSPVAQSNTFAIDILFDAFTARGAAAVVASAPAIAAHASNVTGWTITPTTLVAAGVHGPHHQRFRMRWTVPAAWGTSLAYVRAQWRPWIGRNIVAIGDFYQAACQALVNAMPQAAHHIVLQSCVATDTCGHLFGPLSPEYASALSAGVQRAHMLNQRGWTVLVTSDHGGRETPAWWLASAGTGHLDVGGRAVPYPGGGSPTWLIEGDHLVGYQLGSPSPPSSEVLGVFGNQVTSCAFDPRTLARSFHPDQVPRWLVLPDVTAMVTDYSPPGHRGGGGSHGSCEAGGVGSSIDDEVPLWSPSGAVPGRPTRLEDVAGCFLAM